MFHRSVSEILRGVESAPSGCEMGQNNPALLGLNESWQKQWKLKCGCFCKYEIEIIFDIVYFNCESLHFITVYSFHTVFIPFSTNFNFYKFKIQQLYFIVLLWSIARQIQKTHHYKKLRGRYFCGMKISKLGIAFWYFWFYRAHQLSLLLKNTYSFKVNLTNFS